MNTRLRGGGTKLRLLLAGAVGLCIGAATLVYIRTEILSMRYELSDLMQHEARLRSDVEKLRVEAAALAAPDTLESQARSLGLLYPSAGQVVKLPELASVVAPKVATRGPR